MTTVVAAVAVAVAATTTKAMKRRQFVGGLGASLTALGLAVGGALPARAAPNAGAALLVPGYDDSIATRDGWLIKQDRRRARALPRGYGGPTTGLTRIDLATGQTIRAVLPVLGHGVAVAPSRDLAVFGAVRDQRMIAVDARTLDLIAISEPFAPGFDGGEGFTGGGHCQFLPDSGLVLVTERAPFNTYSGRIENHYGRLTLRDPSTLKVVERYSCHGIHPHEMTLLEDGRLVAVANYGSTRNQDNSSVVPNIVEPSISVIEVASGRLVDKIMVPPQGAETRHLAAAGDDSLFVIQVAKQNLRDGVAPPEPDRLARKNEIYLPASPLRVTRRDRKVMPLAEGEAADFMRHGLSILHDPAENQIIATFPSSHRVMVADAETGEITKVVRTDTLGLRYPCGLALHPDGQRYLVSGSFDDIYCFERSSHALDRDACHRLPLFRHSHIAIA